MTYGIPEIERDSAIGVVFDAFADNGDDDDVEEED